MAFQTHIHTCGALEMGVNLQKHYICSTVTDYLSFFRKQIYEIQPIMLWSMENITALFSSWRKKTAAYVSVMVHFVIPWLWELGGENICSVPSYRPFKLPIEGLVEEVSHSEMWGKKNLYMVPRYEDADWQTHHNPTRAQKHTPNILLFTWW